MKKLALYMALFLSMTFMLAQEKTIVQVNVGIDFPGQQSGTLDGHTENADTLPGISPSIEFMYKVEEVFLMGVGWEYQLERGIEDSGGAKYRFMPLYVTGKYPLMKEGSAIPEINFHIGYNFLIANRDYKGSGDTRGGFYVAGGGGIAIENTFIINLLYRYQSGAINYKYYDNSIKIDIVQQQLTAQIGFRF